MNDKLKNSIILILFCLASIFAFISTSQRARIRGFKQEIAILNQNVKASIDTLRIETTKAGDSEYVKYNYIVNKISELEKLNEDLFNEVKKTRGSVLTVSKAVANISTKDQPLDVKVDSFKTDNDSGIIIKSGFDTVYSPGNFRNLGITTKIGEKETTSTLDKDVIGFTATTGFKKNDKGDYEIFFRSDYPGLTLTKLDGAYITKNQLTPPVKKKRLSAGFSIGYTPIYYSIDKKKFGVESIFSAGFGINIKLF